MNNTAEGINATALCNNPQKEKNKDENKNARRNYNVIT